MGTRRKARKLAVRILYAVDVLEVDAEEAWNIVNSGEYTKEAVEFAGNLVQGTLKNITFIDQLILDHTKNWEMNRIASVDKAILRMGLYEIFFEEGIPAKVTINEAVELAKFFSTSKSHKFVNGILDACAKKKLKA